MRYLVVLALLVACGDDTDTDAGSDAGTADAGSTDAADAQLGDVPGLDAPEDALDGGMDAFVARDALTDEGPRGDVPLIDSGVAGGSLRWTVNARAEHDYGRQLALPPTFGSGEFTMELWIRPDASFPFGSTAGGEDQLRNWAVADEQPYGGGTWWYAGNFLLDGHNNGSGFDLGTFSLQFYGAGRVRWLFGDGMVGELGGVWNAGPYPATEAPIVVDDRWHHIALVRRYAGAMATLELWIDGALIDSEDRVGQVDMRAFWDTWPGFGEAQAGWFWGAEKQAAIGALEQYEDYKGLMAELRYWDRALPPSDVGASYDRAIDGSEAGLVGWFPFDEGTGSQACDALDRARCMTLVRTDESTWSTERPPLR